MEDLVIVGAGGLAREVLQVALDLQADGGDLRFVGFLGGPGDVPGELVHGFPILGAPSWLEGRKGVRLVVAIGAPAARRRARDECAASGCTSLATLVHPTVWRGRQVVIGDGTVICAGTTLTTDIRIGSSVCVNPGCTIGHDAVIGELVNLSPGVHVSGNVVIEEGCDVGAGVAFVQGTRVGRWSTVGAGAVVTRDLPPNVTAVGVPARPIKERPEGWHLS